MKSKIFLSIISSFFFLCLLSASDVKIYPIPQEIICSDKLITIPDSYKFEGIHAIDPATADLVKSIFPMAVEKSHFKIIIGKKGDEAILAYSKEIPDKEEGYYLNINRERIVIAGSDTRGTFYAVQTLIQLIKQTQLPEIIIKDYPDVPFRGVVEGFYGTPWSFEDRLKQIEFYGKMKLNTYIYGPKDDTYHSSPHWRDPYPIEEADKIKQLVKVSAKNQVNFVWAIHPGKDIRWTDSDREAVLRKFENMYELGVRSFAVFFDDISGEGTDPNKQAELLNYLHDQFITKKSEVTPLIMCPTEYNKSWSNPAKGYLKTLGTKLDTSIHIMWTGDRVIAEITEPSMLWINEQIDRPAYIWWNFPVSDYVRDHLLMGRVYGNDLTIKNLVSGFVANPMERAEASKVALFSVADYTWNMSSFDSRESWENSIRSLMPVSYEALYKFAEHNSDLGQNGHGFRREESINIAPVVKEIMHALQQESESNHQITLSNCHLEKMDKEFSAIIEAANTLLASDDNNVLIKEIEPWIYQFKNLGETGLSVLDMHKALQKKNKEEFLDRYENTKALRKVNYSIDKTYNQNPYQPGVKTGSLVLQPFINFLFESLVVDYNHQSAIPLDSILTYQPYKLSGTVNQIKNLPVQSKLNRISIAPVNEIVLWGKDEFIQLELNEEYTLHSLRLNIEPVSPNAWMKVEISSDAKNWKSVKISMDKNPVESMLNPMKARFLRFTNMDFGREISFQGLVLTVDKGKYK